MTFCKIRGVWVIPAALILLAHGLPAQGVRDPHKPRMVVDANGKDKASTIFAPAPEYPQDARSRGWVGTGVYLMRISKKTGVVTRVEIVQSCGHKSLDQAACAAFSRWRFQPGKVSKVECPLTWIRPKGP